MLVPTGRTSFICGIARDEFCLERTVGLRSRGGKHSAAGTVPVIAEKEMNAKCAEVPLTIEELDVTFDETDGFEIKASKVEWS